MQIIMNIACISNSQSFFIAINWLYIILLIIYVIYFKIQNCRINKLFYKSVRQYEFYSFFYLHFLDASIIIFPLKINKSHCSSAFPSLLNDKIEFYTNKIKILYSVLSNTSNKKPSLISIIHLKLHFRIL